MNADVAIPWETSGWDEYVAKHPGATVYHTAAWSRVVCESAGYRPCALVLKAGSEIRGLLPAAEVRSRLTGSRLVSLPFSDECGALAEDADGAAALVHAAQRVRATYRLRRYELRGMAVLRDGSRAEPPENAGAPFSVDRHFSGFTVPLSEDTDAVRRTFARKAVRQTINKAIRLGVQVRDASDPRDVDAFYALYALNRKRHGIPPQPRAFFEQVFARLNGPARARLYMADYESRPVAALITFEYRDVTWAKYEGVDASMRRVLPVYPLFWRAIEDACAAGHRVFDFGRTADDNTGLCEFKSRWGTERVPMPYFHAPPSTGISTVRSDSLKYRVFTGVFQRLPMQVFCSLGGRLFRHFG